jgi:hypothetical protein
MKVSLIIKIFDIVRSPRAFNDSACSLLHLSFYFGALTNTFIHVPFLRYDVRLRNHHFQLFYAMFPVIALRSVADCEGLIRQVPVKWVRNSAAVS